MQAITTILILLLAVVLSGPLARVLRLPLPLLQMALGAGLVLAGAPQVVLDPALFFLLFLPPLLFLDGWRTPRDAFKRDAGTVLKLALGLVVFTVLGMGLFIHWLIPSMPLAVAFALAAVIAPTDPIAVSAIASRHPVPQRLMHILQGEALLNDASGLVCLRFAVAAALTGTFSVSAALLSFAWLAVGGVVIGAGSTWLLARLASGQASNSGQAGGNVQAGQAGQSGQTSRLAPDGGAQILLTLLIPFGVYLAAEALHCSGILAAVAAGLTMSLTDAWPWRASIRLRRTAVWDTVQLAANGSIFVLLGEQLPALLAAAPRTALASGHPGAWWLAGLVGLIVLALALLRFAWVGVSLWLARRSAQRRGEAVPSQGWRVVTVFALAGVRGAVTLAGVLTLPLAMQDGSAFPARDLAIVLASGVIVLSMVLATVLLPSLLRGLAWPTAPTTHQAAEDGARRAGAVAAVAALRLALADAAAGKAAAAASTNPAAEEVATHTGTDANTDANMDASTATDAATTASTNPALQADVAARLIELYHQRLRRHQDSGPEQRLAERNTERRLRLLALRAERAAVLQHGRSHGVDELTLRRIVRELDFQEARYVS